MIIKEKSRSEVPKEYQWNLELMYKTDEDWKLDYNQLKNEIPQFEKYKGNLLQNSDTLYEALEKYYNLNRNIQNLYVYAKMRHDQDTDNVDYQVLLGEIENLDKELSETISFLVPELLKSEYEVIENYIYTNPNLKRYERRLKKIFRFKNHILSEKEEKIISSFSKISTTASRISGLVRDADLKFDTIVDENNQEIELTNSNYAIFIESKNREIRKDAFFKIYKGYEGVKNTLAASLAGEVEVNNTLSKLKNYDSARIQSLYSNEIELQIYDNLIKIANNNLDILYKYYDLKKERLGVSELHLYDIYAPIVTEIDKKYSYEEAKQLIIESLSVLGENYIKDLKQAFDDNWIDIYPNANKKSGAYSFGSYDSPPFILLNYKDTFSNVSTLTHELGHSMHSFYSNKNNEYQDASYKIFVAEVASTVNELLLYKYLLKKSNNKHEKLYILSEIMDKFKSTFFRQTMFAEFEMLIYDLASQNKILTHQLLSDEYYKLNQRYFGNNVTIDEQIKYEWMRIPHFYYDFYVYQYATGLVAACQIVEDILNNRENSVHNYLQFLTTGDSDNPIELLKIAGVDIRNKNVFENALQFFAQTIKEFKEISSN